MCAETTGQLPCLKCCSSGNGCDTAARTSFDALLGSKEDGFPTPLLRINLNPFQASCLLSFSLRQGFSTFIGWRPPYKFTDTPPPPRSGQAVWWAGPYICPHPPLFLKVLLGPTRLYFKSCGAPSPGTFRSFSSVGLPMCKLLKVPGESPQQQCGSVHNLFKVFLHRSHAGRRMCKRWGESRCGDSSAFSSCSCMTTHAERTSEGWRTGHRDGCFPAPFRCLSSLTYSSSRGLPSRASPFQLANGWMAART